MLIRKIPGEKTLELNHLVLDYNGTIASGGTVAPEIKERIIRLAGDLDIHVVTADTFGSAARELSGLPLRLEIIDDSGQGEQKEALVRRLSGGVCALGNGANDREMLLAADLGIAVLESEGLDPRILGGARILCRSIGEALDLLLSPEALAATLRR